MKLTKIALAVACLVGSAQAFAAPVTAAQISAAKTAGTLQQAWISGASAPTKSIYEGWVGSGSGVGCDAGTNTIFTTQALSSSNVTPGSLGNFNAYACTRGGVVSVLYHTIDGGSLNAYTPHTVGTKLARVKFPGTGNGCTGSLTYTDATNTDNNATVFKSCTLVGTALPSNAIATPASNATNAAAVAADSLGAQLPVGGFADVEASLFPSAIGGGDVSTVGTDSAAGIGQVFGVVVSKPLYRAMQVKQGIAANTDALDPSFDPANAPTISKAQYTSIIALGGTFQTDWSPIVGAAGAGKKIVLARRVQTSGSQASSNAFFLANPCASGVLANFNPLTAADSNSSIEVFEGSGTGNVKTRITTASNSAGADNFAIGVISAENDWRVESGTGGQNGYRFVKVEGVHPEAGDTANARVSATNGAYAFHMEMHNFVANSATGFGALVVGQITAALVNPPSTSCAVLPRGLTISPLAGSSCTVGVQVAKMTNQGNNCAPVLLTE
ncbi:MAG TPA: hypothetical protein VES38_00430 [Methylotenera sp.]|nr:hypothetical protein [Methylotenera sp.]